MMRIVGIMRKRQIQNLDRPHIVKLNGKRRPVRLHDLGLGNREIEAVRERLRELRGACIAALPIPSHLIEWLSRIDPKLRKRIDRAFPGMILPVADRTLGQCVEAYFERPNDRKQSTMAAIRTSANKLLEYFGESRTLRSITSGEAMDFRSHLAAVERLATATVSKIVMRSRQLFRDAERRNYIDRNPFTDVKAGTQRNPDRQAFIQRATIEAVLRYVDDVNLKRAIVLARYGGLRIPSELQQLRWDDLNFETNMLRVRSPKTERSGKSERMVPMFPELHEHLKRQDGDGELIVNLQRWPAMNLRKAFLCAIQRAGLEPWPKLFQNLRSTRQTELVNEANPVHVVCAWIGNSPKVANDHYLQVIDGMAERYRPKPISVESGAPNGALDNLIAAIDPDEDDDHGPPAPCTFQGKIEQIRDWIRSMWEQYAAGKMGDTGLEPVTSGV